MFLQRQSRPQVKFKVSWPSHLVPISTLSTTFVNCVALINVKHHGKSKVTSTAEGQKDTMTSQPRDRMWHASREHTAITLTDKTEDVLHAT